MNISLIILKLIVVSSLIYSNSVIPVKLSIENVNPNEVPFKLNITFSFIDSHGHTVRTYNYEKVITQYKESYSGIVRVPAKLKPGTYTLVIDVLVNDNHYMKFKQKVQVSDGINVNYVPNNTRTKLLFKFNIENIADTDLSVVLSVKIFNDNNKLVKEQKEIVTVSAKGSSEKELSIPTLNLNSGKYKAVISYSIVGAEDYHRTLGEVEFKVNNKMTNPIYVTSYIYYIIAFTIVLSLISWGLKK